MNGWKLVVATRALRLRPLQTGVTRHRFCAGTQSCQSTFEQCLPMGNGAARWQSDPSHRFRVTVRESHPGVSAVQSLPLPLPDHPGYPCWLNKPEHTAEREAIIHAGFWAHARRKFAEASDSISRKIVRLIAKLYRIETELREKPELDRSAVRQQKAAPILDNIKTILEREKERQLPKSTLGEAIRYTLTRWKSLTRYLEHSWLEIDNNLVENAIRPTAIGKKNFLFFGSPDSGQTSAVIYSIIETCRKLGINPSDYLHDVLNALPTMSSAEAPDWTPARWKARQAEQTSTD